ncbi:MAG: hypothetical protein HQL34_00790 [Alphaproteobacteria bacterium]|nr:hypothetical protein [Alphaproteobacteria bacterium]
MSERDSIIREIAARVLDIETLEALMGWPSGWTAFGSVGTEWFHWLRLMRCELSRLG